MIVFVERPSKVDAELVAFILRWVVKGACLLVPLVARGLLPQVGLPLLTAALAFYVWWDARNVRPNGCLFSLPFFLTTIVVYAIAIVAMARKGV